MHPLDRFASGFEVLLGRPPRATERTAFSAYLALLLRWNRTHSLTAYREPAEILERLFLDSLLFLPLLPAHAVEVLDLGSGPGIPGIPLAIVEPNYRMTLIEARRRRVSFLNATLRELGLCGVRVLMGRAEALIDGVPGLEGAFDGVVARATGPLKTLTPVALRFLKNGGRFIASGPPAKGLTPDLEQASAWRVLASPVSGVERRFFVVEKTL